MQSDMGSFDAITSGAQRMKRRLRARLPTPRMGGGIFSLKMAETCQRIPTLMA
jgi:hypothetical protein